MAYPSGTVIGSYELVELLATGGMGEVYLARHTDLRREAALKVLRSAAGEEQARLRFKREIDIHVKLSHPNLVRLIDGGFQRDLGYLVMELVDGSTLEGRSRTRPLSLLEFLRLARPIVSVLQYVHGRDITHRDLKPSNVLLTRDGVVKVSDFGLAQGADTTILTQAGQAVGTPAYMPLEVLTGDAWSRAGDLYSLGVIFYELLADVHPFRRDLGLLEHVHQLQSGAVTPLGERRRTGRPELEQMVMRMLSPEPGSRPDIEQVADILENVESGRSRPVVRSATSRSVVISAPPPGTPALPVRTIAVVLAVTVTVPLAFLVWRLAQPEARPVLASPVASASASPKPPDLSPDARWIRDLGELNRLDERLDKIPRGKLDAMGDVDSGNMEREWTELRRKALYQVRLLVHGALEDGVRGIPWSWIDNQVHAVLKTLNQQNFYAGVGPSNDLDALRPKLDTEAADPYFRCMSINLLPFFRKDYKGLDGDRRTAYLRCIQIMEDLAREPGEDLNDHYHLIRYLSDYTGISSQELDVRHVLKAAQDVPQTVRTTQHRMADIALECLPRLKDWKEIPLLPRSWFAYSIAQEARKALEKLVKGDPELRLKYLRVIDEYFGILLEDPSDVPRQRVLGKVDWPQLLESAKQAGFTFRHLKKPEG